jgi:methionyl-tRNA synthetase
MRTLITGTPPTPNGDLHLGHLSGPYTGADMFRRAQQLHGIETIYVTGSDIHQSYVPVKAKAQNRDPLEMANQYATVIEGIFASAAIGLDANVRPRESDLHRTTVTGFFADLYRMGRLIRRTDECLHCDQCDQYMFEAYVDGACPRCGAPSDGNSCEECAWPNVCTDLGGPSCNICHAPASRRTVDHVVFPLGDYTERLREYYQGVTMSPQLEQLCNGLTAARLPDIPITHPVEWGIPSGLPGLERQSIYVWAEMAPGFFAEVKDVLQRQGEDPASWREVWDGARIVQFFGFDNAYFHVALFPALMMAWDQELHLPDGWITNEFLQLDDSKFSKSRGHAIWADKLLAHVPGDIVRYALAHNRPETSRTSFTWDGFRRLVDSELVSEWQGWLSELWGRIQRFGSGRIPAVSSPTASQASFAADAAELQAACLACFDEVGFSPRRATRTLSELVTSARAYADGQARLLTDQPASPEARSAVAIEALAAAHLAVAVSPVMPDFAQGLWRALGLEGRPVPGFDPANVYGSQVEPGPHEFFTPLADDIDERVMAA